jgi:hypothetical protein
MKPRITMGTLLARLKAKGLDPVGVRYYFKDKGSVVRTITSYIDPTRYNRHGSMTISHGKTKNRTVDSEFMDRRLESVSIHRVVPHGEGSSRVVNLLKSYDWAIEITPW